MRNWRVPGIILALLILAMVFRWSTVSTQTRAYETIRYQKDNWNGSIYIERYSIGGESSASLSMPPSNPIWLDSQSLTSLWIVLLAGSTFWLLFAVSKIGNEKTK